MKYVWVWPVWAIVVSTKSMPWTLFPDPKRSISAPKFARMLASVCGPSMPQRTCSMTSML